MVASREEIISYIRQAAEARGMDPDVAVAVARSEGLNADPEEAWQSKIVKDGVREPSYGPYQLYMGGGLGNEFVEKTGLDPRDPSTVFAQIDFSLDQAKRGGWGPWYGARAIGLGEREGIDVATSQPTPEARRAQYGLGDRDPGNTSDVLQAVKRGDMTKDEAGKYVSEELLEGIEGASAYDLLQDEKAEQERAMGMLGQGLEAVAQDTRPSAPTPRSLPLRLSRGRTSATPGTQAIGRFGLESLLRGNPLLGIR